MPFSPDGHTSAPRARNGRAAKLECPRPRLDSLCSCERARGIDTEMGVGRSHGVVKVLDLSTVGRFLTVPSAGKLKMLVRGLAPRNPRAQRPLRLIMAGRRIAGGIAGAGQCGRRA